jgi:hypothetical protein
VSASEQLLNWGGAVLAALTWLSPAELALNIGLTVLSIAAAMALTDQAGLRSRRHRDSVPAHDPGAARAATG